MDCFGRIRLGYSPESCQPLLVNTDIVYSIDEERFPGLEVDGCELSLTICPEYLAVQRLTDGAQPPQAHLGPEDHPIDEAHRELYNLLGKKSSLILLDIIPYVSNDNIYRIQAVLCIFYADGVAFIFQMTLISYRMTISQYLTSSWTHYWTRPQRT